MRLRRNHACLHIRVIALAALALAGCASVGGDAAPPEGGSDAPPRVSMTAPEMERIFANQVDAIEGPSGAIRTQVDGVNIYLISDAANDRMRIVAPFAYVEGLDRRFMRAMLEANFHSTLDARYAISEGAVYAVFIHPISSLTERQIESAFAQVLSLVKTFGTTFTSGELEFRVRPHDSR